MPYKTNNMQYDHHAIWPPWKIDHGHHDAQGKWETKGGDVAGQIDAMYRTGKEVMALNAVTALRAAMAL